MIASDIYPYSVPVMCITCHFDPTARNNAGSGEIYLFYSHFMVDTTLVAVPVGGLELICYFTVPFIKIELKVYEYGFLKGKNIVFTQSPQILYREPTL